MADGTGGIQSGGRTRCSTDDGVDEAARARSAESAEDARRRASADAAARQAVFIAGARCGGGPPPVLQTVVTPADVAVVQARSAAEQQRVDAVVRLPYANTFDGLTGEIVRLKRLEVPANDPALRDAVKARIGELTGAWPAKAHAEGLTVPTASFDPYTASDRALRGAFLWTEVGGTLPMQSLMSDGGLRFRDDIFEAVALRTPGLDTLLLASYAEQPATERALLERELVRLGDHSPCRPEDTVASLRDRRTALLRVVDEKQAAIDAKIRWIGLDGHQGTFEQLVEYELEQRAIAMNPGTTAGSLAAAVATMAGGDIDQIRAAGALGNAWQGAAGMVTGVGDPRKLGAKYVSRISGRRRPPPTGPGLGRRSRAVNTSSANARRGLAATDRRPATSIADKHILNGEVNERGMATGFHHQAPGTEANARIVPGTQTRPNAFGVYSGRVEIKNPATGEWVLKRADSTFFPKTWTRSEVRTAILEAFANRTDRGGGTWQGQLASGMTISGFVDPSGRITSAFPEKE